MSSLGPSPVAVSSDEEPLVRPNTGRDVLPRFSAGPIAVPFVGPVVPRPSELNEPSTQPASAFPTWVDAAVDEDVVAALQFDLEGGAVASSSFALPVQNRFSALDSVVRGNDEMVPTVVDGSGVEVFPLSDDAAVEVSLEPPRHRPSRRLVLIPQVGAHESIQDRQSDEFQGHSTGGRFLDGVSSTLGIHTQVESVRPTIGDSDTESVFQSTPDQSGDEDIARVPETVVVEDVLEDVEVTRATQAAFLSLDSVDLTVMFKTRANVMRSPPKFLRGAYKSAIRVALHEWEAGEVVQSEALKSRAWKLFVLLPRMLLFKPPLGGLVAKSKMVERFKFFSDGRWEDLLLLSRDSAMAAVQVLGHRRRRVPPDPVEHRAERAHNLIQMGELSAARQALDGDPVAPGNHATLLALRDPQRRPQAPRSPLAPELMVSNPQRLSNWSRTGC